MENQEEKLCQILNEEIRKRKLHKFQRYEIHTTTGGISRPSGTPIVDSPNIGVCVAFGAGDKNPYDVKNASSAIFVWNPDAGVVSDNYVTHGKLSGKELLLRQAVHSTSNRMSRLYPKASA